MRPDDLASPDLPTWRGEGKVADVRIPHARLIVIVGAALVSVAILAVTRTYTFYFDEWTFILGAADWTWTDYLQPHNGHPVMLPRLIYAALLNTVGLRSYLPYMAVLLSLHAAVVVLLFEVVRRRAGDLLGLACAALLAVLGAGWENLLWAFQMGFVGSVACGLAMLLALQSPNPHPAATALQSGPTFPPSGRDASGRMALTAAFLLASLMFSGIGLFFGVAAAVMLLLTPGARRGVVWLAPVAIAFAAWYLAFGRNGGAPPPSVANIPVLPGYVLWGLGASIAGLIGESGLFGPVLFLAVAIVLGITWRRRGADSFSLGIAAALVSFYLVTGLTRAQLGYQQSGAGRYVYEGAVLWLLLLAGAARDLPWRGTWRPAIVACIFLASFNSAVLLYAFVVAKDQQMQRAAADLQALAAVRGDPCLNPTGSVDPLVMPQVTVPALYYRAIDRFGDPGASLPPASPAQIAQTYLNLLKPGCK